MVEIISKRDGPRREDIAARRLIAENRGTITRLADQFSGGAYSASRAPKKTEPQLEGLIIHSSGVSQTVEDPEPYVKVSANNRVVLVDAKSGLQMHHIGEIRRKNGIRTFLLATKANGFFVPVDEEVGTALSDLDGFELNGRGAESELATVIGKKLHL